MACFRILFPVFASVALVACGGGGGSDPVVAAKPPLVSGVFIGPPVEGLRYETASRDGLTDADGTFEYHQGETVRFYVGDILLGEARGAEELTPLDLAGIESPPVTAREVRAVANQIESFDLATPFEVATNIASFIYTLDDDADISNGIFISPDMHALAAGRSINFNLTYDSFPDHYPFRKLLGDARLSNAWTAERQVFKASYAMDLLYMAQGLSAQIYGPGDSLVDAGNDGSIDTLYRKNYTYTGQLTVSGRDDGNDGTFDDATGYFYDNATGNLVAQVRQRNSDATRTEYTYDSTGFRTKSEVSDVLTDTVLRATHHTRDDYGQRLSSSEDKDMDGNIDSLTTFIYDVHGNLVEQLRDTNNDGIPNQSFTFEYNSNGHLIREASYLEPGKVLLYDSRYTRNEQSQILTYASDDDGDGTDDTTYTTEYAANGQILRRWLDANADGTSDYYYQYSYNADGHLVKQETRDAATDEVTSVTSYTRDELGNILDYSIDTDADGTPEEGYTQTYDLNGNAVLQLSDANGDGTVDVRMTISHLKTNGWATILDQ